MKKAILKTTAAARGIMRSNGAPNREIWTNKYVHCKTVKGYLPETPKQRAKLLKELRAAFGKKNVSKGTGRMSFMGFMKDSVIVRFSNT